MNKTLVEMTRKFLEKHRFALDSPLLSVKPTDVTQKVLNEVAGDLLAAARRLEKLEELGCDDPRIHRAQLLVEELGETIDGMAGLDERATLDGLADLAFVTVGTALALGLPFLPAFYEVCKSNLTKTSRKDGDPRLRNKGGDWQPPDIRGIIEHHRSTGKWCATCGMLPAVDDDKCYDCEGYDCEG